MNDSESTAYININDAAELTGYAVRHLRKFIKQGLLSHLKKDGTIMVPWSMVQQLAQQQKPFWVTLPDSALDTPVPPQNLLLHTADAAEQRLPVETFYDRVEIGSCIDWMQRMPSQIIQSVVTSPPYWGVRKYPGVQQVTWSDGSNVGLGEEATVEEYVSHTLEVLRHLKRVLRDDGTIWWNLGDTYQTRAYLRESSTERLEAFEGNRGETWRHYPNKRYSSGHPYLKDKDLALVPFMVAMGAERIGLYVRSIIVWYKDHTVPEPVVDRPTTSHEYILLLAKSRFYKYDKHRALEISKTGEVVHRLNGTEEYEWVDERNLRTVWQFPPSNRHGDHTAAFPLELPTRCLQLCTTAGDLVFDPFVGSGTTLAAAKLLDCRYFGCDVVPEFVQDADRRLLNPSGPLRGARKRQGQRLRKPTNGTYPAKDGSEHIQEELLGDLD